VKFRECFAKSIRILRQRGVEIRSEERREPHGARPYSEARDGAC
jgi:hypothetical protein